MSQAEVLQAEGIKLFQQRKYDEAARIFREAQAAFTTDARPDMVAEMVVNIGLVLRALGENQQALDSMQEAITVFEELGDAKRAAMTLGNMGGVYMALDDKEQAYNCYRQAADIFEELGEKQLYGETLVAMADLQVRDGKVINGAATYEVGLENLGDLSTSQKVIKGLLGVRNKLTGGGPSK